MDTPSRVDKWSSAEQTVLSLRHATIELVLQSPGLAAVGVAVDDFNGALGRRRKCKSRSLVP